MAPQLGKHRRYYTQTEVSMHNCAEDCWVSIFHKVYDLTKLIEENRGPMTQPIIDYAGEDITHWFDEKTREVKTHIDEATGLRVPYTPHGRFVHVPPSEPLSTWKTDFGTPWWKDEAKYCIGTLSKKTRRIQIVNVLTEQEDVLEVCSEETVNEILTRYLEFNSHAASYTWKHLIDGEFFPLDMTKTLEENGMMDEALEFERLGIDDDYYIPCVHLYYNDDLTVM